MLWSKFRSTSWVVDFFAFKTQDKGLSEVGRRTPMHVTCRRPRQMGVEADGVRVLGALWKPKGPKFVVVVFKHAF